MVNFPIQGKRAENLTALWKGSSALYGFPRIRPTTGRSPFRRMRAAAAADGTWQKRGSGPGVEGADLVGVGAYRVDRGSSFSAATTGSDGRKSPLTSIKTPGWSRPEG
jgi:hypothetical protein